MHCLCAFRNLLPGINTHPWAGDEVTHSIQTGTIYSTVVSLVFGVSEAGFWYLCVASLGNASEPEWNELRRIYYIGHRAQIAPSKTVYWGASSGITFSLAT